MRDNRLNTGLILAAGGAVAGALLTFLLLRRRGSGEDAHPGRAALRDGEGPIRSAGPDGMRSRLRRAWTREDEASDESFPASDPPAY